MGIKGWYLTESDNAYSSYTDFTKINEEAPAKRRVVKKKASAKKATAAVRTIRAAVNVPGTAPKKKKKKRVAKALLCTVGALVIVLTGAAGVLKYLSATLDEDSPIKDLVDGVNARINADNFFTDNDDPAIRKLSIFNEKVETDKIDTRFTYSKSDPAYAVAQKVMESLWCGNDVDTAWEIFNWVHSNISYQPISEDLTFEEAAYRGFTRKSGDCFVFFACSKMLLDCAGIPNMAVERYPIITNGHFWNLVQLDGEWYHCDATVFRDHPDMYFMCTDDEIGDQYHSFNGSLYPERASGYSDYYNSPEYYQDNWYSDDLYYDGYNDDYEEYYPDENAYREDDSGYWNDDGYYGEDEYYTDDYYVDEW